MNLTTDLAKANHLMVEELVIGIGKGLEQAVDPNLTTSAEILSAIFTVLSRTLLAMQDMQTPEDKPHNRREIGRVLGDLHALYGATIH